MQKRYLWIVAVVAGVVAGGIYYASHIKKQALAQFQKGEESYKGGDYQGTVSVLEKLKLSRITPSDHLKSLVMLAESYHALGNLVRANAVWKEVLASPEIDSNLKDRAQFQLALMQKENAPGSALSLFQQLAKESQNPEVVAGSLLEVGKQLESSGNLIEANQAYQEIFTRYAETVFAAESIDRFGGNSIKLLFSKKETPYAKIHQVRPGESLAAIAKKYNIPLELLMEANELTSGNIHPNDRLKVVEAAFSIEISKTKNVLLLRANGDLFKVYRVGTGREGSTPIGMFKITSKLKEPTWYHPDGGVIAYGSKENLLGTRWMGIDSPGYGIHGTWEPNSVGKQSSAGCVRLRNQDVEELYKIVTIGTPVTITE